MTEKPNWESLNFDSISDWCEEFLHYAYVEDDLADVGIHCKEIDTAINDALMALKNELDKMKMVKE